MSTSPIELPQGEQNIGTEDKVEEWSILSRTKIHYLKHTYGIWKIYGMLKKQLQAKSIENMFNITRICKSREGNVHQGTTGMQTIKQIRSEKKLYVPYQNQNRTTNISKGARDKNEVTCTGSPIRVTADFSARTFKQRKLQNVIFQPQVHRWLQDRLLYPAKFSIIMERKIKLFFILRMT